MNFSSVLVSSDINISPFFMAARLISLLLVLILCPGLQALGQPVKGYDVLYYDASIKLDRSADSLAGRVMMTARADSSILQILQHAKYLTIDSIFVNGIPASVSWQDTAMGIYYALPHSALPSGRNFTVQTYYHGPGKPEQNRYKWGGVTNEDTMMFAMGVGFAAPYTSCTRHWLPCYDLPDDKPDSADLTFICRDGDLTVSNGLLVSNTVENGYRTMHWHISHPIASYLLTFATGPYTVQQISNSLNKPFEVFALKRDSMSVGEQMKLRVSRVLAFYDSLFAPYPFEKVGYVVTPIGSMEHQTMISLGHNLLGINSVTAIHELAHQWWGDWVTCKTFDDAWLNEGFATYCESLVLQRFNGQSEYFGRQRNNVANEYSGRNGFEIDSLPLSGAPTVDGHTNNYPGTIYAKGAVVLGMLRDYLGDSLFFAGIRKYGRAHA